MIQIKQAIRGFLAATLLVAGLVGVSPRSAHANQATECTQQSDAIVISNSEVLVVAPADESWGTPEIGPLDTSVPAGTYSLEYVSFDNHSVGGDLSQDEERWFIEGYNDGSLVFTSGITSDVPADQDYQSGTLNTSVSVPELDSIVIQHVQDVDPDGTLPQSVYPVCVSFTPEPELCDDGAGFVKNAEGDCVCQGGYTAIENSSTYNSSACECPENSIANSGSDATERCTPCSGDLEANATKSTCECPEGTIVDASDDTKCNDEVASGAVLGDSTTKQDPEDPSSVEGQTTPTPDTTTPQVLASSTGSLVDTGASQIATFVGGALVALLALYVALRRTKA